jgi:translation initiation factor 1
MDFLPQSTAHDPFAEIKVASKINLRIQQRNGKKSITTIQGLDEDLDQKRICKAMQKQFSCNGNIKETEEYGTVIQLQGDQRELIKEWLITQEILSKEEAEERIVIHGA